MSDPSVTPRVPITLDRERNLSYPLPSLFAFEDATGVCVYAGVTTTELLGIAEGDTLTKEQARKCLQRVIDLCWAGLIAEDPALTKEQVGRWIYMGNMFAVRDKCIEAMFATLPQRSKDEAENESPLAQTGPA